MNFFNSWLSAWSTRNHELHRIADALERIAPELEPADELKADDAVTYVDEQAMIRQELIEEADALTQYMAEHAEELDVQQPRD